MDTAIFREGAGAVVFESLEPRLLLSGGVEPAGIVSMQWGGAEAQARNGEWIVRFSDAGLSSDKIKALGGSLADIGIEAWALEGIGESEFGKLTATGFSAQHAAAWASKHAGVLYVEPNFIYSVSETTASTLPDDPTFSDGTLWGLHNTGQSGGEIDADIDAPEAWDLTTGSSNVVIAVIDTGVNYNHTDLAGNMWTNPDEIPGDGFDNDGNGYVDDIYGWNFADDNADPMDGHDHGTHVAGTIGGAGDDGAGITGVNWDVSIMALKFMDDSGSGSTESAINAIEYATMMKRDYGVNVVATNNSWGGGWYSSALFDAIENAGREGVLFVAAAGNEGVDNDLFAHYPSNYDSEYIISVAATDRHDNMASFSNYGAVSVDVGAPGVAIYSSVSDGGYESYQGTSMAAPHVAGVAALLAAHQPDASVGEIRQAILAGADPIESLDGNTSTGARLNAFGSLLALGAAGPRVMSVSPSGSSAPIDTISVYFSENLDPASVVGANFLLRTDGADEIFGTPDDGVVPIADWNVTLPQNDVVAITFAGDLAFDDYRLTIIGSGASPIRDPDGNPLNQGADNESFFEILEPSGDLEQNDTIYNAVETGLSGEGEVSFTAAIGDGLWTWNDVDIFKIEVTHPATLITETDTDVMGSSLDTILRLFNGFGHELAVNDDADFPDSMIQYEIDAPGDYYVGVSGYDNFDYSPYQNNSGWGGSEGEYYLSIKLTGFPEIRGSKWDDRNGDGVRGAGESPVVGSRVFIDSNINGQWDAGEQSRLTNANGDFAFEDLPQGTYVVGQVVDAGWLSTYPNVSNVESYAAYTTSPEFENIAATGQAVLAGADDDSYHLSAAELGGFEFPMYGESYDGLYINSNGLLTFEEPDTEWFNGDLNLYPQGAAISVFWDDLDISDIWGAAVYWDVRGSGADERLIIQWQSVEFYDTWDPQSLTFQAILCADGRITLNYADVSSSDDPGSEGAEATVGVKGSLFFGHRLLLSYNSGPGKYVGTGVTTHIVSPKTGQQVVTLDAGQVATDVSFGVRRDIPQGDANFDGVVNDSDVSLFASQFGLTGPYQASDFDGDGDVDLSDFAILRANFPTPPSAPRAARQPEVQMAAAVSASAVEPLAAPTPEADQSSRTETDVGQAEPTEPVRLAVRTIDASRSSRRLAALSDRAWRLMDRGDLNPDVGGDDGVLDVYDLLENALPGVFHRPGA